MDFKYRISDAFNAMRKTLFPTVEERAAEERKENVRQLESKLSHAIQGTKVDYHVNHVIGAYGMMGGVGMTALIPHYEKLCKTEQVAEIAKARDGLIALGVPQSRINLVEQEALQAQHRKNPNHYDYT